MESVVYAIDWNQARENVFSGAAWLGSSGTGGAEVIEQLRKPTALICSTKGAERPAISGGRQRRDDLLLDMIRKAIVKGGTVLIPTDTSARVLELAYLLDHAWHREISSATDSPLKVAKLYLASRNVGATMRYARSMLEWMDENIVREFEAGATNIGGKLHKRTDSKPMRNQQEPSKGGGRTTEAPAGGPFEFKLLKLLERKSQVERLLLRKSPKVILASDTSLAWGFSKDVLRQIAADPQNLVILTDNYFSASRNEGQTSQIVGRTLWEWFHERRDGIALETGSGGQTFEQVYTDGRDLRLLDAVRTPLEGKELLIYQQYLASERQLNPAQSGGVTALETSADAIDETSSTSSSSTEESDPERQGKALNISATLAQANRHRSGGNKEIVGVNVLLRQPGVYDYDVRGKKGRDSMFPYVTKRRRADDFGELIRPEDYLRAEERDEVDGKDMRDRDGGKHGALGQKRKWGDSTSSGQEDHRTKGASKRQKVGDRTREEGTSNGVSRSQANDRDSDDISSSDSDTDTEEPPIGPSKLTFRESTVKVNLRIAHVDLAGLHDQRSLSMLIPLIQPRKLVLVAGTPSETTWLAEECRNKLKWTSGSDSGTMDDILTPVIGQTVSASMDTNAWTVKLGEALVKRLHWQNVKGLGVVTLTGWLTATATTAPNQPTENPQRKRQKLLKEDNAEAKGQDHLPAPKTPSDAIPTLDVAPPSLAVTSHSIAQPLHVGDLRLADLRRILQSSGHVAEFKGEGTLVIDELVAVRKSAAGLIEVESGSVQLPAIVERGQGGSSFQAVRRRIYEGLAVIAGG